MTIIGKPTNHALEFIIRDNFTNENIKVDKSSFLMFGDTLTTDIMFGKNSGIDTVLTLSGVTKYEHDRVKI